MKKRTLAFLLLNFGITSLCTAQHYTSVSAGLVHGSAVRSDGTLWTWGNNGYSQLGDGTTTDALSPINVATGNYWVATASGGIHQLALDSAHHIWGCGDNEDNQLGLPAGTATVTTFQQLNNQQWKAIFAGAENSAAIGMDGSLWMSGFNTLGCLGQGDTVAHAGWVPVDTAHNWLAVSIADTHVLAIKTDGTLWGWGVNYYGNLARDTANEYILKPVQLGTGNDWKAIAAGYYYSLGIKNNGTLFSWGLDAADELGRTAGFYDSVITQVGTDDDWMSISAGTDFALAIKTNHTLWGWGDGVSGELGLPASTTGYLPTNIAGDSTWQMVTCADGIFVNGGILGSFSAGLKDSSMSICTTGTNFNGTLGNGTSGTDIQDYFDCETGTIIPNAITTPTLAATDVTVFPNPVTSTLSVLLPANATDATLRVYNSEGKLMLSQAGAAVNKLHVEGLPPGIYMLQVQWAGGTIYRKFSKQ